MPGGAPRGNKNNVKGKQWETALKLSLATYDKNGVERGQALRRIADVCVEQALAGDKDARTEIGNRLDGKPAQAIVGDDRFMPIEIRHTLAQSVLDGK